MPHRVRFASIILLLIQACHHYVPIPPDTTAFQREDPGYVEVVRRTGEPIRVAEPRLERGAIVGRIVYDRGADRQMRYTLGERVEIPLTEIESIWMRKLSVDRSIAGFLGFVGVVLTILYHATNT